MGSMTTNEYRERGRAAGKLLVAARKMLVDAGIPDTAGVVKVCLNNLTPEGWELLAVVAGMERAPRYMERMMTLGVLDAEEALEGESLADALAVLP